MAEDYSWDDLDSTALLCGGGSDDENENTVGPSPPTTRPEESTTGPRVSGGFAAAGKASALLFGQLREGMIIVRHVIDESAPLFKNASKGAPPPPVSAPPLMGGGGGGGRDLLAALRNRSAASTTSVVITPLTNPTTAAASKSVTGADISSTLASDYVTEEEATASGIPQSQLYSLTQNMLCVKALVGGVGEQTVVCTRANGDVVTICHFGQTATSPNPQEKGVYYRAGRVEENLFLQWRADPAALQAVLAAGEGKAAAIGSKRPREEDGGSSVVTIEGALAAPKAKAAPARWWVAKGLVVRYVPPEGEDSDPHFGKKGTVVECSEKDNRVTIRIELDAAADDAGAGGGGSAFAMVRCKLEAVDTVIPKVGGRVMVLRPSLAGEITKVAARSKDPATGDPLVTVVVDDEQVVLKAEEVCQLA